MNTLSKTITTQILNNSDIYPTLRAHWCNLLKSSRRNELSSSHHILYLALLGKDWRKGFATITNPRKLANGGYYGWKLFQALARFHSVLHQAWLLEPFDGIVTPEILKVIREIVPKVSAYDYNTEEFANGCFPFEAYKVPEATVSTRNTGKEHNHA